MLNFLLLMLVFARLDTSIFLMIVLLVVISVVSLVRLAIPTLLNVPYASLMLLFQTMYANAMKDFTKMLLLVSANLVVQHADIAINLTQAMLVPIVTVTPHYKAITLVSVMNTTMPLVAVLKCHVLYVVPTARTVPTMQLLALTATLMLNYKITNVSALMDTSYQAVIPSYAQSAMTTVKLALVALLHVSYAQKMLLFNPTRLVNAMMAIS